MSDSEPEVTISRSWLVRGLQGLQRRQAGAGGLGEGGRDDNLKANTKNLYFLFII